MKRVMLTVVLLLASVPGANADSFEDFNQGVSALARGENDVAIAALSRALAATDLMPNLRPTAYLDRGLAYERAKRFPDAIADLNQAIRLKPDYYMAVLARAGASYLGGNAPAAATDCNTLTTLLPHRADLFAACGVIEWQIGDFKTAMPYFEKAASLDGSNTRAAFAMLWFEITRLRAGDANRNAFPQWDAAWNTSGWPAPLLDLYLGKERPEEVEKELGSGSAAAAPPYKLCETAFFIGEWDLLHRLNALARTHLATAASVCSERAIEHDPAVLDLKRLDEAAK
ncbi:MAG TPA: tetratricopeptide repeat protein [Rhizomicrobium sp.]